MEGVSGCDRESCQAISSHIRSEEPVLREWTWVGNATQKTYQTQKWHKFEKKPTNCTAQKTVCVQNFLIINFQILHHSGKILVARWIRKISFRSDGYSVKKLSFSTFSSVKLIFGGTGIRFRKMIGNQIKYGGYIYL